MTDQARLPVLLQYLSGREKQVNKSADNYFSVVQIFSQKIFCLFRPDCLLPGVNVDQGQEVDGAVDGGVHPPGAQQHLDALQLQLPGGLDWTEPDHPALPHDSPLSLDGTQDPPSLLQLRLRAEDVTELHLGAALTVVGGAQSDALARAEVEECRLGGGPEALPVISHPGTEGGAALQTGRAGAGGD